MASRPRPELPARRRYLAVLIDDALNLGQRADGTPENLWRPWKNQKFGDKAHGTEATVRGWRNRDTPVTPTNIIPLLRTFFGDGPRYAEARETMKIAWRDARGFIQDEPQPPPSRSIKPDTFSEFAEIVDLAVSQPVPDNNGNLIVGYTLNIHPDAECEHDGQKIEIGVTAPYVIIESTHWRPTQDSVFRNKTHPHVKRDATPGGVLLSGPLDAQGRIDGAPLGEEPKVTLEPLGEDGPITFSVRVKRDGFKVTPREAQEVTETQKAVLDAIFGAAIEQDKKKRLILARDTVRPGVRKPLA